MTKSNADKKTLELIEEVNRRKAEISRLERPNWATNCSFSFSAGNSGGVTNIHVCSSVTTLIDIAAFLRERKRAYEEAASALEVEAPPFVWDGFSVEDWLADIKTRIDKIQIAAKKKKLETLETRLNSIISPELRRELELQRIEDELK